MRILGIDPGLSLTGYGCVDISPRAAEPILVEAGVLRLQSKTAMSHRLCQLFDDLSEVIGELKPDVMVVEKLFTHYKHVRTGVLMAHARGVVLLAGQMRGIKIEELGVTEVKRAVAGNGHASKLQVQHAVKVQCNLQEIPEPPDVADAIAIALCAARRLNLSIVAQ